MCHKEVGEQDKNNGSPGKRVADVGQLLGAAPISCQSGAHLGALKQSGFMCLHNLVYINN